MAKLAEKVPEKVVRRAEKDAKKLLSHADKRIGKKKARRPNVIKQIADAALSTRTVDDGQNDGVAKFKKPITVEEARALIGNGKKKERKKEEEKFLKQIIDLAHLKGYIAAHFRPAMVRTLDGKVKYVTPVAADGKGFPDLVIAGKGMLIVVEAKIRPNTPTDEQTEWIQRFKEAFVPAYVWYPEDWDQIVSILR